MLLDTAVLKRTLVLTGAIALLLEPTSAVAEQPVVAPPAGIQEVGGSNYVMFHVDESYRVENQPGSWNRPGVLQPVIGTFHLQDRPTVLDQLKTMHAGGQRKIALMLWNGNLPLHSFKEGVGLVIPTNDGAMLPLHQDNLREFLTMVHRTGYFDELVFRFAVQGESNPMGWQEWNERLYQETWQFILHTRRIVQQALEGSSIKIRYDLAAELGGLDNGQVPAYNKRLWQDYCRKFGSADSYGFSIAAHPGRLARLVKMFQETGVVPEVFALDLYFDIYNLLAAADAELKAAGIERSSIIIQEVAYNDPKSLAEIQRAQRDFKLEVLYLMQWPIEIENFYWPGTRQPRHFSVDYPAAYDAYLQR